MTFLGEILLMIKLILTSALHTERCVSMFIIDIDFLVTYISYLPTSSVALGGDDSHKNKVMKACNNIFEITRELIFFKRSI